MRFLDHNAVTYFPELVTNASLILEVTNHTATIYIMHQTFDCIISRAAS